MWLYPNEDVISMLKFWTDLSLGDIVTTKHVATIYSEVYILTINTSTMNAMQNESHASDWNGLDVTMRLFLTFFVIAGLISNSLVWVLFCPLKRLKTWDNAFTINLAVGDLMSSVAAITLVFTPEFPPVRMISCHSLSVMRWCRFANFMFMQEIALLRYWRVHRPGHIIKKSVFMTGIVIPWTAGIASMCITSMIWSHTQDHHSVSNCMEHVVRQGYTNSWFSLMLVPLLGVVGTVVMTTCYVKIMLFYRRQCRIHAQIIAAVQIGTSTENNSGREFIQRMDEFYQSQINEDKRVVMNSFLVVAAFYIANIPTVALRIYFRLDMITNISPSIEYWSLSNIFRCAVNPVLYSIRSKYFRDGLKRLFRIKPNTIGTVLTLVGSTYMWIHDD